MSAVVTPELVRRYLKAIVAPVCFTEMVDEGVELETVIDVLPGRWHEARLGMLAMAEKLRAKVRHMERPEANLTPVGLALALELDVIASDMIREAGVDPSAWDKTRPT